MNIQRAIYFLMLFCCATFAAAQNNLVANPFFNGVAPAGWVTSGTSTASSYTNFGAALRGAVPAAISAAGGTTAYDSGCVGTALACLSYNTTTFAFNAGASGAKQTITTTIGEGYYLVFWTYFSGTAGTTIQTDAYWGSNRVYSTNPTATGWTQNIINLGAATSASTVLAFLTRDDPAFSQITYVQVYAYPSVKVTKTSPSVVTVTQPYVYTVTLSNASAGLTSTSVTLADTISTGGSIGSYNCRATSTTPWVGACPAASGAFPVPAFNLAPLTTLTFTFTGTVNASTTGTVTNNASAISGLRSTLTSVLSATASSAIIAPAFLSLSKTNTVTTVTAGGTTQYQITASNAGPAYANQALVKDIPSAGLSCTNLTCTATGGAVCPSSLTVAGLTGAGLSIPSFPSSSTVAFLLSCNVTATGT